MLKINKLILTSVLACFMWPLAAQDVTNSPYTRYGYGELGNRSFGAGRAMGGVGYGLRSNKQINPMNPASYSSVDSLTFIFDFGISGQLSWFDDGTNRQHDMNGNVDYFAMQFPVHRRVALSFGLLPYSHVGYKFGNAREEEGVSFTESFTGSGGVNDLYGGLSIDLWKKRLAVGANFGFLFGSTKHQQTVVMSGEGSSAYNTIRSQEVNLRNLKMDFGLQYTHPFSRTESVTFGFVYSPKRDMHATTYNYMQTYTSSNSAGEILESDTLSNRAYGMPNTFGMGVSYTKQNKLTIAADFSYENWEKMLYFGEGNQFNNYYRVAGGAEYIPRAFGKNIFQRTRYRAGVSYGNSYLKTADGKSYNEIGASIGLGIPLIDGRSLINISFEYQKKMPEMKVGMIKEDYFRFTVNYTFNEMWFRKLRVD